MNEIKIKSCHCEQCRKYVKNKRKNRFKKKIKRMLNKKRRKSDFGVIVYYYWA